MGHYQRHARNAIGSNREAARTAGLNVLGFSILPYVISGALSTVAITFSSAQVMSINPVAGTGSLEAGAGGAGRPAGGEDAAAWDAGGSGRSR